MRYLVVITGFTERLIPCAVELNKKLRGALLFLGNHDVSAIKVENDAIRDAIATVYDPADVICINCAAIDYSIGLVDVLQEEEYCAGWALTFMTMMGDVFVMEYDCESG